MMTKRLVDAALAAGATDFLVLPTLDAMQLERTVQFSLRRRRVLDTLSARETCLAAARERDRQQLANALHDGPLQDLIGARFLVGALTPGGSTENIQSSLQAVSPGCSFALCSDLKPPALGPFGLEKAIPRPHAKFSGALSRYCRNLRIDGDQSSCCQNGRGWRSFVSFKRRS